MKSIYHGTAAANSKLRGKKFKVLSCKCCVLINVKEDFRIIEAKKEITNFKRESGKI
jgi:hypothetical protein